MENAKKSQKKNPLSRTPYVRRSEQEMAKIASEIQSGLLGIRSAYLKYGLCRNTLKLYLIERAMRKLGESNPKQKPIPIMSPDLKGSTLMKEIQRLSKELEYANLNLLGLETMIQEAEKHLQIKKKKYGSK